LSGWIAVSARIAISIHITTPVCIDRFYGLPVQRDFVPANLHDVAVSSVRRRWVPTRIVLIVIIILIGTRPILSWIVAVPAHAKRLVEAGVIFIVLRMSARFAHSVADKEFDGEVRVLDEVPVVLAVQEGEEGVRMREVLLMAHLAVRLGAKGPHHEGGKNDHLDTRAEGLETIGDVGRCPICCAFDNVVALENAKDKSLIESEENDQLD